MNTSPSKEYLLNIYETPFHIYLLLPFHLVLLFKIEAKVFESGFESLHRRPFGKTSGVYTMRHSLTANLYEN